MKKVSVIIPVYNVEKYLDKCLDSLVHQTIDNYEIIVVNDGTKDNSQNIIDEYKSKYPSLIVSLIKENGGLSSARNYGIEHASGEYVGFVDSDDYVDKDMFRLLYEKAKENNFDMVVCDFNEIHGEEVISYPCHFSKDIIGKANIQKRMVDIYPSAWNKIYKRELFSNIRFKEGVWFEDVEFLYRLLPEVDSIGVVNKHLYQYLIREGAITSSNDLRIYHYIDNWNGILEYYKEKDIYDVYKEELEYCYVRYLYATFIKTACKFDKQEYKKAVNKAMENVKKHFPNYKNNKYINEKGMKNMYLKYFNSCIAGVLYSRYHK